jgi:hypothetical protein
MQFYACLCMLFDLLMAYMLITARLGWVSYWLSGPNGSVDLLAQSS